MGGTNRGRETSGRKGPGWPSESPGGGDLELPSPSIGFPSDDPLVIPEYVVSGGAEPAPVDMTPASCLCGSTKQTDQPQAKRAVYWGSDDELFSGFIEEHYYWARKVLLKLGVRQEWDQDELVQDALLRIWSNCPGAVAGDPTTDVRKWFWGALFNAARGFRRTCSRRRMVTSESMESVPTRDTGDPDFAVVDELAQGLQELKGDERAIIIAVCLIGTSIDAFAAQEGYCERTAYRRLETAKNNLKTVYERRGWKPPW